MKVKDAPLRDRLKAVRAELDEARSERAEKLKEKESAKETFAKAELDPKALNESAEFKAAEEAVRAVGQVDDQIADLKHAEESILAMLGEDAPAPSNGNGPADLVQAMAGRNPVAELLKGEKYQALLGSGAFTSKSRLGSHVLGELASRDEVQAFMSGQLKALAAEVGSDNKTGAIPADRRGIVLPNLKPLTLLDLIPAGTTDSNVVEFVQVTTIPSSAATVAEGDAKPEQSLITKDADAPVRTIAGYIKVRKQALADVAGLQSLIGALLPYDVKRKLESEILVGEGEDQELLGILNTPGIGAPEAAVGDNRADTILRAVTTIYLADGDPDFTAMHPLDRQDLLLMRENEAERTGAYLYGTPAMPVAPTIWGLAITNNRAVPQDSPLVGDSHAAMVLYREGLQVLVSDSDQDDFIKNRATVLAELRAAFPVIRPSSFAVAPALGS